MITDYFFLFSGILSEDLNKERELAQQEEEDNRTQLKVAELKAQMLAAKKKV